MSNVTYPLSQTGSFNAGTTTNIIFHNLRFVQRHSPQDVTGSFAGSAGAVKNYTVNALPVREFRGAGSLMTESDSVFSTAQTGTVDWDGIFMKPQTWVLRKTWPLIDTTGSGGSDPAVADTDKEWWYGTPVVSGAMSGIAISALRAADLNQQSESAIAIQINGFGTLTMNVVFSEMELVMPFSRGGPFPLSFSFLADGDAVATTSIDSDYQWLFPNTLTTALRGSPVRGQMTVDLDISSEASPNIRDAGGTAAPYGYLYDVQIRNPANIGGRAPVEASFIFDHQ